MYTKPQVKKANNRYYIEFYYRGERLREYNGSKLSLPIFPNRANTAKERTLLLQELKTEFAKALEDNWNPFTGQKVVPQKEMSLEQVIVNKLNTIATGNYSRTYQSAIKSLGDKILKFLTKYEKKATLEQLETERLLIFLDKFNSSNRNYMNKRQYLNVLVPGTIAKTPRKRYAEKLHQTYESQEMKTVLDYLKESYPKLYMVALLTYGCFVRPHEEARLLQKYQIKEQKIFLSGDENKGKKVRVIYIPDYVYEVLLPYIDNCADPNHYLFSGDPTPVNFDYFRTQWSRAKSQMLKLKLIQKNQTLYSFRHTGAVKVYRQTKDAHIVQQLLGHSSLTVTLKYLRGLGETNSLELRQYMPTL